MSAPLRSLRLCSIPLNRPQNILPSSSLARTYSSAHPSTSNKPGWTGRPIEEHVTNHPDTPNVHSEASRGGKQDRAAAAPGNAGEQEQGKSTTGGQSQAATEKDHGSFNKKAKEEHPEAPGPVIGMNDEKGGAGR